MLVTLFGISVIIFVLLRIVPGNIVDILFDAAGFVDPADKANLERELGLDQSIVVQYLHWIVGLLQSFLGLALSVPPEFVTQIDGLRSNSGASQAWRIVDAVPLRDDRRAPSGASRKR